MVKQDNKDNELPASLSTNYTYTVLNNIIFISVVTEYNLYRGSGASYVNVYYYDINADKELTYKETLTKLGVDEKNVLKFVASETKGTDLQKIDNIYPTNNNQSLYVFYETENAFMGYDKVTYNLIK